MEDSIFTKIIKGEIPCHKIYEDEHNIAFLDINPATKGHTLVVPKRQIDHLWDLPEEDYASLMQACKKVAQNLREKLTVARVGVRVEGVEVPHAHVHLIPFNTAEEFKRHSDPQAATTVGAELAKQLAF